MYNTDWLVADCETVTTLGQLVNYNQLHIAHIIPHYNVSKDCIICQLPIILF